MYNSHIWFESSAVKAGRRAGTGSSASERSESTSPADARAYRPPNVPARPCRAESASAAGHAPRGGAPGAALASSDMRRGCHRR